MSEPSAPGLGDLFAIFGGVNPLTAVNKNVEQFKRGVNEFLNSVENFNATLENLNTITTRLNALLDDVEEPIRAIIPQVTRSIKAADAIMTQISGPIERVTPGINRLADTLSSPVFTRMPTDIGTFLDVLTDLSRRLQPLSQMAETAGSLFGLRPLAALRTGTGRPLEPVHREAPAALEKAAPPKAIAKTAAPKKAAPKKAATKKAATKKAATKGPAKKPATRKTATTRAATKKPAAKKTSTTTAAKKRAR